MSFLHVQSCECIKSELDLFALPSTQTSIEGGQWIHYKPLSSLTDDSPIEFVIPGQSDEYVDLSQTMIYIKVKVVKNDGPDLTDAITVLQLLTIIIQPSTYILESETNFTT